MKTSPFGIPEFEFTVPSDYNHDGIIADFVKELGDNPFTNDLAGAMDAKASDKLEPGKTYRAKLVPLKQEVKTTEKECIEYLLSQKGLLIGVQGLLLTYYLCGEEFPLGRFYSFGKKDARAEDYNEDYGVSYLDKDGQSNGDRIAFNDGYPHFCSSKPWWFNCIAYIDYEYILCVYKK